MGLFDKAAGSLFGSADSGGIGTGGAGAQVSNTQVNEQVNLLPLFSQLFSAAGALGISLTALFGDAIATGKEGKKAAKKAAKSGSFTILPFGKDTFIDFNKLFENLPQIFDKLETAQTKKFNATFEKLSKVPSLEAKFKQALGGPSPQQALTDQAFGQLGEFSLGAAAKTGLLNNSLVQAKALAPIAQQKAQFEITQQNNALAQALGLAGAPGLTGASPLFTQAVPTPGQFGPAIAQAASTSGFLSAQNQQAKLKSSIFNADQGADFFGSIFAPTV